VDSKNWVHNGLNIMTIWEGYRILGSGFVSGLRYKYMSYLVKIRR